MTKSPQISILIPEELAGLRLDQGVSKLLPDHSRMQIKSAIDAGLLLVDGKTVKPKMLLKGGEHIEVAFQVKEPLKATAEAIPLNVVYEDEEVLVINKPVGLVVHPGAGNSQKTLLNALLHYNEQLRLLPRAGILHRLDKNTSGVLIVAKSEIAYRRLSHQLKKRRIIREYQAVINGVLIAGGKIDAPIGRHHIDRKRMTVTDAGKSAVTHYRVMQKFKAHTHVLVRLETGRTHQIRVHFAHLRYPIVGDPTYGGRLQIAKGLSPETIQTLRQFKRQALHAFAITFAHPITEQEIRVEIDLPQDMKSLLEVLNKDK